MESTKLHATILSSPGMGHLVPVLELGKRLATHHGLEVTILVVTTHSSPAESQLLDPSTVPKHLRILQLPPVDVSNLVNPDTKIVTLLAIIMRQARPSFGPLSLPWSTAQPCSSSTSSDRKLLRSPTSLTCPSTCLSPPLHGSPL
ncbi:hypothetical protein TEA_005453 [Camellia sinensis var. sinensis]|uniref:Uncharacterized protein n=1 Tax=Camellia sinensis var. sinensis TaxID=542762 RepID=A0A4S4E3M3_CAMSN|nr:hypothetical protein TEA_005453 [Camellia sinensis var. sinensis]